MTTPADNTTFKRSAEHAIIVSLATLAAFIGSIAAWVEYAKKDHTPGIESTAFFASFLFVGLCLYSWYVRDNINNGIKNLINKKFFWCGNNDVDSMQADPVANGAAPSDGIAPYAQMTSA